MRTKRLALSGIGRGTTFILIVIVLSAFALWVPLWADSPSVISQGFTTRQTDLQPGSLVSGDPVSKDEVRAADINSANRLVGVVAQKAVIEVEPDKQKVQVVTSGVAQTLVSDLNGEIKKGDAVTASPVAGVGMKTRGGVQIAGVALNDMQQESATERTIQDREGKSTTIHVGRVDLLVNVAYYPTPDQETIIPSFLQQFAATVAGKDVSAVRVLTALAVVLIGLAGAGVLLYASVRSSIISIGRNPLSEHAVRKSLISVGIMCAGIIIATIGVVYLILKL
jgi:hypothetical protein